MIRYDLVCAAPHAFDGWFRSSADFDAQAARGLVACPVCGSTAVAKALMAPAVRTRAATPAAPPVASPAEPPVPSAGPPAAPVPAGLFPPEAAEMVARLRALKAKLLEQSENVGRRFPEEARRIHYGEAPERAVYGEASPEEAQALIDEGVGILPLPVLPDEQN